MDAAKALGEVLQIDNCALVKKSERDIYGTTEHFQDSDKTLFAYMHVNPAIKLDCKRWEQTAATRSPFLGPARGLSS